MELVKPLLVEIFLFSNLLVKTESFYNGSVGKGFGYGAQHGLLVAQGDADARAGIRLSGADMIIGGQLKQPIPANESRKYCCDMQI